MTSYAGLIVFAPLFKKLGLKDRFSKCSKHLDGQNHYYTFSSILLWGIVHVLLGYQRLRDADFYRNDPMVLKVMGMKRMPSVETGCRMFREFDNRSVEELQGESRNIVLERINEAALPTTTLDFDGSVLSTKRHAEGTSVGFNPKKKGARGYYPLFCTVAQTGQVLDFLHRTGAVHDSNGSKGFIQDCFDSVRQDNPGRRLETRMDSAFFDESILALQEQYGAEYTMSVPFERFPKLKNIIGARKKWKKVGTSDGDLSYFTIKWKPKKWARKRKLLCVRRLRKKQQKGPLQLDLFEPMDCEYEYKVIVTNKSTNARKSIRFHEGRGTQEGIFGQMKSQLAMDYVPSKKLNANKAFLLCNIFAHNLTRELQMQAKPKSRGTTEKRAPLWIFETIDNLRKKIIQQAGRFTYPQGKPTLTMNYNPVVEKVLSSLMKC